MTFLPDGRDPADLVEELRYAFTLTVVCEDQAKCDQVKSALNTKIQEILPDTTDEGTPIYRIKYTVNEEVDDGSGNVTLTVSGRIGWRITLDTYDHSIAKDKRDELVQWMADASKVGIISALFKGHLCPHASTVRLKPCVDNVLYQYP